MNYHERLIHDANRLVNRHPTRFSLYEYKNDSEKEHVFTLSSFDNSQPSVNLIISTRDWRTEKLNASHVFETYVNKHLKIAKSDGKWNSRFLKLAKHVSEFSKDPSTKVGAVIVDDDDNVRTIGYNGFPRGVKDTPERLENRDIKYPFTVHAELNAICTCARVGVPTKGATMVCTHFPCAPCAGAIVQAGFKDVLVIASNEDFSGRWAGTNKNATTIFIEGGVDVVVMTEDEINV